MSVTAALLLLNAASATPSDITPVSLAVQPRVLDLGGVSYDWSLQQRPSNGMEIAQTAICDTVTGYTRNGKDTVPDCRFDQ